MALALSAQTRTRDLRFENRQEFERSSKVALVVGVGAYPKESGLAPLKFPALDAEAVAAELKRQGYAVNLLTDARATRSAVRRMLTNLREAVDPGQGSFVFFFAGHGFAQDGANYLATANVSMDDLKAEGLPVSQVEELLRESKAKRQMMFIDACRNDPAAPGARATGQRSFADLKAAEGMRALYATKAGSVSYEADDLKHGVFTHFLLKGLRGEAANPEDKLVTFRDLSDYVIAKVKDFGVAEGRVQVPFEAGESSGDFLLGRVIAGDAAASVFGAGARAGDTRSGRDGQSYLWIPPGHFDMGCSPDDAECAGDEKPRHGVRLTKGFWMGRTEVTAEAFAKYAAAAGAKLPPDPEMWGARLNPAWKNGKSPVTGVLWDEAVAYCGWIGGRLPTEAEWEYSARAGSAAARYGELDRIAWTGDNSGSRKADSAALWRNPLTAGPALIENGNRPRDVGVKQANAFGLHDMLGNAWEWTADWYDTAYSAGEETNPKGAAGGSMRVARGGAWSAFPRSARASARLRFAPGLRNALIGFRCVVD